MPYNLFPAVDETYQFPPEVRAALASSLELRNTVVPMTTTLRNNLSGAELWDGRLVFNTTLDRLNYYDLGTLSWVTIPNVADIDAAVAAGIPLGAIIAYGGSAAPTGWHLCNGSAHGSSALQTLIGSANTPDLRSRFIVGAGQGYVDGVSGAQLTSYTKDAKSTTNIEAITLTSAQSGVPAHSHTASSGNADINHTHSGTTNGQSVSHNHNMTGWREPANFATGGVTAAAFGGLSGIGAYGMFGTGDASADHNHGFTTGNMNTGNPHNHTVTVNNNSTANASSSHENRPPYWALTYIIKKV